MILSFLEIDHKYEVSKKVKNRYLIVCSVYYLYIFKIDILTIFYSLLLYLLLI